jgi:hypothetical protein
MTFLARQRKSSRLASKEKTRRKLLKITKIADKVEERAIMVDGVYEITRSDWVKIMNDVIKYDYWDPYHTGKEYQRGVEEVLSKKKEEISCFA